MALIGHSWGGDAAVNLVARKLDAPIDLLISLDPAIAQGSAPPENPQRPPLAEHPHRLQPEHLARHPQSRGPHRRPVGSCGKRRRERLLPPGHDPCVGVGGCSSATVKKSCGNAPKAGSKKSWGGERETSCKKFPVPLPKPTSAARASPFPSSTFTLIESLPTGLGKPNVEALGGWRLLASECFFSKVTCNFHEMARVFKVYPPWRAVTP